MKLPNPLQALRRLRLRTSPAGLTRTQRANYFYTQMDAAGVGLTMAVDPFVAVFLARLGASNQQIGLFNAIPGFAGLSLALVMGRFLQTRRSIVPWYSAARFVRLATYGVMGLAALLLPPEYTVVAVLGVWLLASVPQTLLNVAFSVLMNAIAGPRGRYALLSRRWSTIGVVGAVMTVVVGQVLDRIRFPLNYQLTLMGFAFLGATTSFLFARRIDVPAGTPLPTHAPSGPVWSRLRAYGGWIWAEQRPFVAFVAKRVVYTAGSYIVLPLYALYYVRELQASDVQISIITTVQKALLMIGYFVWPRLRQSRGSRFILLSTTLALSLYPAFTAMTRHVAVMTVLVGIAAIFQAGINLVFFDELMQTVPDDQSATFVSISQSVENLLAVVGPIFSTSIAGVIGLGGALLLGAGFRLAGFALFLFSRHGQQA